MKVSLEKVNLLRHRERFDLVNAPRQSNKFIDSKLLGYGEVRSHQFPRPFVLVDFICV